MVETRWEELRDKEIRFRDQTWKLTGTVSIRKNGEILAVEAREVDDVKRRTASLVFNLENPPNSINPGNLGEHFDSLERTKSGQFIVVKTERRTYRYRLNRLE